MTKPPEIVPIRTHVQRTKEELAAWIAEADPDHIHRWITTYCGGNHVPTGKERWSGGTIGYDKECACGARVHLGY